MRVRIDVPMDATTIGQLGPKVAEAIQQGIHTAATRIQAEAQPLMPVKTGALRASFKATPTATGIDMEWGEHYAEFVDLGATSHQIVARNKEVLHFFVGGKEIFTKRVNHPGFQGQFFRLDVGSLACQILNEEIRLAISRTRIQ